MLIGGVMSISNLYVGLKTGWGLGVTITACIIAFAVFRALEAISQPRARTIRSRSWKTTRCSSAASAAGYMSSAGLVSAIPALYLTTGRELHVVGDDALAGRGLDAGRVHGHSAQAAIDQYRQASLPHRPGHGRNAQEHAHRRTPKRWPRPAPCCPRRCSARWSPFGATVCRLIARWLAKCQPSKLAGLFERVAIPETLPLFPGDAGAEPARANDARLRGLADHGRRRRDHGHSRRHVAADRRDRLLWHHRPATDRSPASPRRATASRASTPGRCGRPRR